MLWWRHSISDQLIRIRASRDFSWEVQQHKDSTRHRAGWLAEALSCRAALSSLMWELISVERPVREAVVDSLPSQQSFPTQNVACKRLRLRSCESCKASCQRQRAFNSLLSSESASQSTRMLIHRCRSYPKAQARRALKNQGPLLISPVTSRNTRVDRSQANRERGLKSKTPKSMPKSRRLWKSALRSQIVVANLSQRTITSKNQKQASKTGQSN